MTVALLVAACGAALALVAASAAVLLRARAYRRRQALLVDLADDVGLAMRRLARALDRTSGARPRGLQAVGAPPTLEEVLGHVLTAAVEQAGADAAAARVEGSHGEPVSVARGEGVDIDLLESALAATGPGAFGAATVRWSYPPTGGAAGLFRTATVVPIVEDERVTGALVAFASSDSALGPTEERALRSIADEAASRLAAARRYEELDRRYLTYADTGVRNRTAYEIDLERALAHSRENARPLSVVLLGIVAPAGPAMPDRESQAISDVARAASRLCRRDDVVYRRGDRQLAVLLRGTDGPGAVAMAARMEGGVRTDLAHVTVACARSRARESADSLDARAAAALEAAVSAGVEAKARSVAADDGGTRG
jgi:GGDEF domain-containing protein